MKKSLLALAASAALLHGVADAATFTVVSTATSGAGSLAQAITDANATAEADTIQFNIAGAGVKTIGGVLPAITKPLTIDGYTQPGTTLNSTSVDSTNAVLRIFLDGTQVSSGGAVLKVNAGPTTIRGLAIGGIKSQVSGIEVAEGVTDVAVRGCFVGTDATGTGDSSAGTGILVRGTASIGSSLASDRNLVSGNSITGVVLRGPSSKVLGNLIGTTAAGAATLGNGRGVQLAGAAASGNLVGDHHAQARNVIAGNSGDGILVAADAGSGNTLDLNRFFDNGGLSIDLGGDGPTANDADDSDTGPNGRLNAPELSLARVNGTTLKASLALRVPTGSYRLHVFAGPGLTDSGFGEGEVDLGGPTVTTGVGPFRTTLTLTLPETVEEAVWVSAVITSSADGSTGEFSRAVQAVDAGSELVVTTTADSGAGSLRAAIDEANQDANRNTIVFAIPGDGPKTIALQSSLWVNDFPLLIDGYSQAGAAANSLQKGTNAKPGIVLDGAAIDSGPVLGSFQAPLIVRGLALIDGPEDGLELLRASGSAVEGCFAGVKPDMEPGPGNTRFGVFDSEGIQVRIGGPNVGERNLLAANAAGLRLFGTGTQVFNNIIGTAAMPNLVMGLSAVGTDSQIGGDDPAFFNSIVGNIEDGIHVSEESSGNSILGNVTYGNGSLGINLSGGSLAAVTPNDLNDADAGANGLQNFPVLTSVVSEPGLLTVEGTLDVPAARLNSTWRLHLYRNEDCDPSGHGEGEELIAATDVFVGSDESFSTLLSAELGYTQVTATITDPETGNTSEFSACKEVVVIPACGDTNADRKVLASDALTVLKAAVGSVECDNCICDANASGSTTSSDALAVLRKAVGQAVSLACPACS